MPPSPNVHEIATGLDQLSLAAARNDSVCPALPAGSPKAVKRGADRVEAGGREAAPVPPRGQRVALAVGGDAAEEDGVGRGAAPRGAADELDRLPGAARAVGAGRDAGGGRRAPRRHRHAGRGDRAVRHCSGRADGAGALRSAPGAAWAATHGGRHLPRLLPQRDLGAAGPGGDVEAVVEEAAAPGDVLRQLRDELRRRPSATAARGAVGAVHPAGRGGPVRIVRLAPDHRERGVGVAGDGEAGEDIAERQVGHRLLGPPRPARRAAGADHAVDVRADLAPHGDDAAVGRGGEHLPLVAGGQELLRAERVRPRRLGVGRRAALVERDEGHAAVRGRHQLVESRRRRADGSKRLGGGEAGARGPARPADRERASGRRLAGKPGEHELTVRLYGNAGLHGEDRGAGIETLRRAPRASARPVGGPDLAGGEPDGDRVAVRVGRHVGVLGLRRTVQRLTVQPLGRRRRRRCPHQHECGREQDEGQFPPERHRRRLWPVGARNATATSHRPAGCLLSTTRWLGCPASSPCCSPRPRSCPPPPRPRGRRRRAPRWPPQMRSAGGGSGALAVDLDSGRQIFASRPDTARVPASVNKLFTTATALTLYGRRGPPDDPRAGRRRRRSRRRADRRPLPARRRRPELRHAPGGRAGRRARARPEACARSPGG